LNVNYPIANAKGTEYVGLAAQDSFDTSYSQESPGVYTVGYSFSGDRANSSLDAGALTQGYATLTLIDPSYGVPKAPGWEAALLKLSN